MLNGFCSALAGHRLQHLRRVGPRDARDRHGADGHRGRRHRRHGADRRRGLRARRAVRRAHHRPDPEPDPVQRPAELVVDEHRHRLADARVHRRPEPARARSTRAGSPREARRPAAIARPPATRLAWRDRRVVDRRGAVVVVVLGVAGPAAASSGGRGDAGRPAVRGRMRAQARSARTQAASLAKGGAVDRLRAERRRRAASTSCTRSIPTAGSSATTARRRSTKQRHGRRRHALVAASMELGWFTDNMYSTSHTPCGQCFTYFTTVTRTARPRRSRPSTAARTRPAKYWLRDRASSADPAQVRRGPVSAGTIRALRRRACLALAAPRRRSPAAATSSRPQDESTPDARRRRRGLGRRMATQVDAGRRAATHVDLPLRNDTGDWSAMSGDRRASVKLVGQRWHRRPPATPRSSAPAARACAPGFRIRGYTGGTKAEPETQLLSVECAGAAPAPGRSSRSATPTRPATSTTTGRRAASTATLEVDLDAIARRPDVSRSRQAVDGVGPRRATPIDGHQQGAR